MFSSNFIQGASHSKCDDHAIDFESGAIICDGCSSSKFGNVAAGIVSYLVMKGIQHDLIDRDLNNDKVANFISAHGGWLLQLQPDQALDTTLFAITEIDSENIYVYGLGDGYILIKYKDGSSLFITIDFSKNTPAYITYLVDRKLRIMFLDLEQDRVITIAEYTTDGELRARNISTGTYGLLEFSKMFLKDSIDTIAVFSDGLGTFPNMLDPYEIALSLVAFKTVTAGMATRRMNTVVREYGRPADDLSIGVWKNV